MKKKVAGLGHKCLAFEFRLKGIRCLIEIRVAGDPSVSPYFFLVGDGGFAHSLLAPNAYCSTATVVFGGNPSVLGGRQRHEIPFASADHPDTSAYRIRK